MVEVIDNGPGIPPLQLLRIMEPFYTTKSKEKGSGLGLSISREIVEHHGGTLRVRSQVGEGTTFIISLPAATAELEEAIATKLVEFGGECSDEEITKLSEISERSECDVIVGIGGGKTLDTAKAVANELKLPVVMVPSIASTDAPCSAVSVIYTSSGGFKRYLFLSKNPDLVLIDVGIIARSPVRFLISGMGDALATWFEAESCRLKSAKNMAGGLGSIGFVFIGIVHS